MHRRVLFALLRRRWALLAVLLGTVLLLLPTPAGLTLQGYRILVIVIVAVILWVTEAIPLPAVAFLIAAAQVLLVHKAPNDVVQSFFGDAVFFIMGALMLAVALVRQRVDRRIAFALTRISGPKTKWVAFTILAISAVMASFIADHTVAALMLPVALALVQASGEDEAGKQRLAKLLLFCVAYGCAAGGVGTPSGGARNIIMVGYWEQLFDTHVGYATWMKFAYPIVLIQIPAAFAIVWFGLRPKREELTAAVTALREDVAEEGHMGVRQWAAVGIFVATLVTWIAAGRTLGLGVIAVLGASCYLIFGLVEWSDYNSGVNWGVVLVYAAAISLGGAMKETGAAEWVAVTTLEQLAAIGIKGGIALLAVFSLVTVLFTNIMSDGATVAVVAPILLEMAGRAGLHPVVAGLVVAISSAFAYLTVFGTPPSMIVYGSGHLRTTDFVRLGWRMAIMSIVVLLLTAKLYWPHLAVPQAGM